MAKIRIPMSLSIKGSLSLIVLSLIILLLPYGIDGLYCYRCLALDCGGNPGECEGVREFVVRELRQYYHIPNYLQPCPAINDSQKWYVLQADEDQCPGMGNSATCTAGRLQIRSSDTSGSEKSTFVSHATVMGCATINLLNSIRDAKKDARCDLIQKNGTSHNSFKLSHSLVLEHCSDAATVCHNRDFCVEHFQSVVKEFRDTNKSVARFDYGLVLGIAAFVVVIFAAVIGASLFSFPLNQPSNLPKTIDNADLVTIRSQRRRESSDDDEILRS